MNDTTFTWRNIPGWMDFYDLYTRAATELARPGAHFVEVGVLFGRSAAFMATLLRGSGVRFDAVDCFRWTSAAYREEFIKCGGGGEIGYAYTNERADEFMRLTENPFFFVVDNLKRACPFLEDNAVHLIESEGASYAAARTDASLDFVFIDAAHTYEDTAELLLAFLPKVRRGSVIAGHDHVPATPGVVQAVAEILGPVEQMRSSFWWVKP